jgi:hypothetical protein
MGIGFNPLSFVSDLANTAKNVGESLVDLAEGDFAGAATNFGEALENNPLALNGGGYKALGKLLEGDVAGAGAELVEGVVNAGIADDVAQLFGIENLGEEMAVGIFGAAVRDPKGTGETLKEFADLPPARGTEIAAPHTPQRPSAYARGKRGAKGFDNDAKLPQADNEAIRAAAKQGLSLLESMDGQMADLVMRLFPAIEQLADGKFDNVAKPKGNAKDGIDERRAAKDAAKAAAKARAKDKALARADELRSVDGGVDENRLVPEKPPYESAVSRLKPPVFFEDLIAAFMTDLIQASQSDIREKTRELDTIKAKRRELREATREQSRAIEKGENGGLGGLGSVVGDLLKGPAGAAAMALLPPPANFAAGLIGPALDLFEGVAADGAQKEGLSLKEEQDATLKELDATEDSITQLTEDIKNAVQRMQQMQTALSNILNAMHQTAMNTISNIR